MRSYVTWLIGQLKQRERWINYRETAWHSRPSRLLAALMARDPAEVHLRCDPPPSAFICDRWPLTSGNSAWWRRRTSCRYFATARSRWLSSVRATSCTSMRAPTWTRFSSSTPSTTNPTSPSPTRILSRWVPFIRHGFSGWTRTRQGSKYWRRRWFFINSLSHTHSLSFSLTPDGKRNIYLTFVDTCNICQGQDSGVSNIQGVSKKLATKSQKTKPGARKGLDCFER